MKKQLAQAPPKLLKPHPRNSSIYGINEDVTELVELIRQSEWIKPLVVNPNNVIVSGHRRWKAALELGIESVPVETREFPDEMAELKALLLENANRFKTTEQKVREAQAWQDVEGFQARQRKLSTLKQGNCLPDVENFPHRGERGKTRDVIASRVGIGSGRTYQKAAKVVTHSDESASLGHQEVAQLLCKTLNEQSVDAAHALLKKTPEDLQAIANLIISGKAKSTRQAAKMINKNNSEASSNADSSENPSQPSFAGFSVGDWVEISEKAHAHNKTYIGQRGRVDQVLAAEQLISVSIEGVGDKVRFEPRELILLVKAPPQNPVQNGDIVVVHIERCEVASAQEKRWNSYWGKVTRIGETGSLTVDVGAEVLQLFPRDVKPGDPPSAELRQVAERVLRLRRLELDEVEEGLLDMFQRREWFTPRQLAYLDFIEKFYLCADLEKANGHQVIQFRGR